MSETRATNPMFGPHPFKIGLFGYLHDGGMGMTKAPERWRGRWEDIEKLAVMADTGGLDFMMPISSWRGWKGEIDHRISCFETLTHAAALAALTKRIGVFSTVHAPLVHPVFAAKALTTIDHVSRGRAGLNIVCGWQTGDFKMFGVEQLEHDTRYEHGLEWFEILSRLLKGPREASDYSGKYFQAEGLIGQPASVQQPSPAIFSAAYSPAGRDFAIKTSDLLLTSISTFDQAHEEVRDIRAREAGAGRQTPLGVIATSTVVCRETRKEAEAFNRYYALEMADNVAIDAYRGVRAQLASAPSTASEEAARMRTAGGGAHWYAGRYCRRLPQAAQSGICGRNHAVSQLYRRSSIRSGPGPSVDGAGGASRSVKGTNGGIGMRPLHPTPRSDDRDKRPVQ